MALRLNKNKARGIIGELIFDVRASKLGLRVLKPVMDDLKYDRLVDVDGSYYRVQIKTTSMKEKGRDGYTVTPCWGGKKKRYTGAHIDTMAVYLLPLDLWYLIPVGKITARTIRLYPHRRSGKYKKFLENWAVFSGKSGKNGEK